jgi:cbb3-type cytochrome oxidase subunit 3
VLGWHVALIVIAAVLFALLVIGLVVFFLRQRNRENNDGTAAVAPAAEAPSAQNQAVARPSEYAAVVLSGAAATPLTASQYGAARGEYGIAQPFAGSGGGGGGDATISMRVGPSGTGTGTYGIAPPFATSNFVVATGGIYDVAPPTLTGTGTYGVVEPAETASNPYEATGAPLIR